MHQVDNSNTYATMVLPQGGEVMQYRLDEPCSSPGCSNKVWNLKRKLCQSHTTLFSLNSTSERCSIEECEKKVYARGWCRSHYERWRHTGNPVRPVKPKVPCAFEGCDGIAEVKGWCGSHYAQWYAGREMKPIRRYLNKNRTIIDENGERHIRMCKTCGEWKVAEEGFYRHGKAHDCFQSECKVCMGERARRNKAKKKGLSVE